MDEELVDSTGYPILDAVIHYCLFIGAVFQLICIFAVIFVPKMEHEQENEEHTEITSTSKKTTSVTSVSRRKHEKKKRR